MATVTLPTTFADGTIPTASQFNGDFNAIVTQINGNIDATNVSSAIVTTSGTQTLSSKTLTKPTVNGSIQAMTTDTDGATVTFNMSASNIHSVTLGGNRTLAVSNVSVGQVFLIRLIQDGTGTRTVTWFSGINWPSATAPTLTTTASKTDVFGFLCTATNTYDGFIVGQNL